MSFFDFNDAEQQQSFDLIPKGTLARVRMSIKPGASMTRARAGRVAGPLRVSTAARSTSLAKGW